MWHSQESQKSDSTVAARVLTVVAWCGAAALIALAFACSKELGLTWDEPLQLRYGNRILNWYYSGFRDSSALTYATPLFQYGGLFEAPAQAIAWFAPYEEVATRHLLTSLTAALGVMASWRLASHVAGPRAGLIAAALLTLTPVWIGHGFFNSKDIPFATAAAWALYATLVLGDGPRPVPWRSVFFAGLTTGIALGVRPGGAFLLAYPAIAWIARSRLERRLTRAAALSGENSALTHHDMSTKSTARSRSFACVVVFVGIAWITMLIAWPWAQLDPLRRPLEAMWAAAHFGWSGDTLFRGAMVHAQSLPRDYLPTWFAITLPETYFVAAACAVAMLFAQQRRKLDEFLAQPALLSLAMLAFAAFAPVIAAIVLRPVLYDAQRHFLFVLPPLAALGACALLSFLSSPSVPRVARVAASILAIAAASMTAREMIALHPYEYVYFNRLEGGLPGASTQFETDYWGASYQEGLAWVVKNVHPSDGRRVRLSSCAFFYETRHYVDDIAHAESSFEVVKDGQAADIVLNGTRHVCPDTPGRVLHVIAREGVQLLSVIRRYHPRG